jgi:hypothetical protein
MLDWDGCDDFESPRRTLAAKLQRTNIQIRMYLNTAAAAALRPAPRVLRISSAPNRFRSGGIGSRDGESSVFDQLVGSTDIDVDVALVDTRLSLDGSALGRVCTAQIPTLHAAGFDFDFETRRHATTTTCRDSCKVRDFLVLFTFDRLLPAI